MRFPSNRARLLPPTAHLLGVGCAAVLVAGGCFSGVHSGFKRVRRQAIQERLARFETPGLVLGEFPLAPDPVVDGDTIKVEGLDTTLRLLAIDTEETFKTEPDIRAYETMGWEGYKAYKQGDRKRPAKFATPMGMEAKHFAERFFAGVETVRLERDHPKEIRGRYGRYLVYVFAKKGGQWVNYNIEAVRAGMSPYFMKYGYSRRFHKQFMAAQYEARVNRRGIWDPSKEHYDDYDLRLQWWTARAEFIRRFEEEAKGRDDMIMLTNWDAPARLEAMVGREVEILATVSDVVLGDRGPSRVTLSRRLFSDFPLIFFDKDVLGSSGIARYRGEFVRVRGVLTRYTSKRTGRSELQIVVKSPGQITISKIPALALSPLPGER